MDPADPSINLQRHQAKRIAFLCIQLVNKTDFPVKISICRCRVASVRIVPVLPVIDKFHTIVFRRFVMHFDDLQTSVTPCALITR